MVQRRILKDSALFYAKRKDENMNFSSKLPQNKKEFALFMAVISVISVNIIAPLITCFESGFRLSVWAQSLQAVPFIWLNVIVLVLLTYKPAEWLTGKIVSPSDSFNSHILANILCSVLLMSVFLTIIGTWIGMRQISLLPIQQFFYKWPRNFSISFAVECCVAQPIARFVMYKLHQLQKTKAFPSAVRAK